MLGNDLTRMVSAAAVAAGMLTVTAHAAEEIKLPSTLAMTAYGTGSSGYTQMAAVGSVLKNEYNTAVRILPGENDVSRMTPLKTGRVDLCACGIASYFGSEGVFLFADRDWGPQPIRVIVTSIGGFGLGVAVAGDVSVETPADLRGKRVSYVRGDDALNVGTEAYLAFGNLTWDDVERVTFPGYGRAFDGIINDQADAAFSSTVSPPVRQLAASPRGISWPTLDPGNEAAWERFKSVAPYFQPHDVTAAAGDVSNDNPWQGASYPYPILIANQDYDDDIVYNLIRFFIEKHDSYKNAAPGNEGYALESQNMFWVIPLHEAVVKYYKKIGHWTPEMQEHQDMLVRRQEILQKTWQEYMNTNPPEDDEAFAEGWMAARANALDNAGMNPVFR